MDITTLVFFVMGLILLISGAEFLVRGASQLAIAFGISPLVVGLTVVAFGTSSPELAVAIVTSFEGKGDIAMGNVIGSNIANVLLILGIGAVIAPLIVAQQLVRLEVPIMIAISVLMYFMALDGSVRRLDGLILFAIGLAYVVFTVVQSRRESADIQEEYAQEFTPAPRNPMAILVRLGMVALGVVMLVFGSAWLSDGAVAIARYLGLSELVIGLTVVAIGTSLPEVATVVIASLRGERDIAVGNAIGSNLFNILIVLGIAAMVSPQGIPVTKEALTFDIPIMIVVAIACLPIFFTSYRIDRWEGVIFLVYYAAYLTYLVLDATQQHSILPMFTQVMYFFVIPLTVITLVTVLFREFRSRRQAETVQAS